MSEHVEPVTIYTTGYTGRKPAHMHALLENWQPAVLVDIRFSATSRHFQWTRKGLSELLGSWYEWLPAFGNKGYKTGRIEIADPDRGLTRIQELARLGYDVILMCGCAEFEDCHRKQVAEILMANGFLVEELSSWELEEDDDTNASPSLF